MVIEPIIARWCPSRVSSATRRISCSALPRNCSHAARSISWFWPCTLTCSGKKVECQWKDETRSHSHISEKHKKRGNLAQEPGHKSQTTTKSFLCHSWQLYRLDYNSIRLLFSWHAKHSRRRLFFVIRMQWKEGYEMRRKRKKDDPSLAKTSIWKSIHSQITLHHLRLH